MRAPGTTISVLELSKSIFLGTFIAPRAVGMRLKTHVARWHKRSTRMFDRKPARHSLVPVGRGLPNIGKQGPWTVRGVPTFGHSGASDGVPNGCAAIADGPQPCHTNTGVAEVAHEAAMSVGSNRTASPSPSVNSDGEDRRKGFWRNVDSSFHTPC